MRKYTFIALMLVCLPVLGIAQSGLSLSITGYDAKCNGSVSGSAKVVAAGGAAPYTYSWAPLAGIADSISGLVAGIYSVTVTDSNGVTASGSITINQPPMLTVSIDSNVVPPCFRTTAGACGCYNTLWAVVSGGTAPYSYLWTPGTGVSSNTDDTLMNACYLQFTIAVTDSNNCISTDSLNIIVPETVYPASTTGTAIITNTSGINTYPNPTNNQFNISIDQSVAGKGSLAVYNMMGEKVYEQLLNGNETLISLDVSGFAAGYYLLKIASGELQKTAHFSVVR